VRPGRIVEQPVHVTGGAEAGKAAGARTGESISAALYSR